MADNVYFPDEIKDDDHFFHLTCHVDPNLVSKVERGEFVELEKLLPRPKGGNLEDGHKTELIFREGKPVIVPHVDKSRAITGIQKWNQAFHIYAAIYFQANPGRSSEIWQYVHVMNTAAYNHAWSQVAEYDFAFRQMMASNPKCSWARIYAQMWNICFSAGNNRGSMGHSSNFTNHVNSSRQAVGQKSASVAAQATQKPTYCWKFNKGKCKFGSDYKFVNRFSLCDLADHGLNKCPNKTGTGSN